MTSGATTGPLDRDVVWLVSAQNSGHAHGHRPRTEFTDHRLTPAVLSRQASELAIKPTENICYSDLVGYSEPLGGRGAVVAVIGGGASGGLTPIYMPRADAAARGAPRRAL